MKKKEKPAKELLIEAFENSGSEPVVRVCRKAGISRNTFYTHFNNDPDFRRKVLEIQRDGINAKIAESAV